VRALPLCRLGLSVIALNWATTATADWTHWGGDATSTKYAPYDQIHAGNVDSLKIIWRYKLPTVEGERSSTYRGTPLVIDGVLYTFTPSYMALAVDARTGKELWRFTAGGEGAFNRGVAYWRGADGETRLLFGTQADTLYSLDAKTGLPDPAFGSGGRVDLTQGMRAPVMDPESFGLASPPIVAGNVVIVGSIIDDWHDGTSPDLYTAPGDVRGYDVRTGELLWTFHTILGLVASHRVGGARVSLPLLERTMSIRLDAY
jgi:quinoprotein glucose dehydrogenase